MPQANIKRKVVILGAGVIGLTTAVVFSESGYEVTVVAEHVPGKLHPDYTSPWAGAHWRSYAEKGDLLGIGSDLAN